MDHEMRERRRKARKRGSPFRGPDGRPTRRESRCDPRTLKQGSFSRRGANWSCCERARSPRKKPWADAQTFGVSETPKV